MHDQVHEAFGVQADSALQAARQLGFVDAEAQVLAQMFDAQRRRLPRGASVSGFALQADNLPVKRPFEGFAPLVQRSMGLYAIVPGAHWIERVLAAGVRTVQLRVKQAEPAALAHEVERSVRVAEAAGAQLFINDHWRLAIEHGAYGVHLGQEDLDSADLHAIRAAGLRLGISTHCYAEVCRAWALRPSYIACGPIHATQLKVMPWLPQGEDNLAYWSALLNELPVVGIGGMDAARCLQAMRCGVDGVCVVSAITGAPDPEEAMRALQAAVLQGQGAPQRTVPLLPRPTLPRVTAGS